MSCLYKIEASQPLLSKTERKIAEYIIQNRKEVFTCTAQSLADVIPTSAAAIIRFSKKLGYSGFSALKLDLASDPGVSQPLNLLETIQKEDDFSILVKKTKLSNQNILDQIYSMINEETFDQIVDKLRSAKRIYLIGDGSSGIVCQDFQQKLLRLGYVAFYHADMHVRISSIHHIDENDVLIAISYSGQTSDIIKTVEYAKKKKCMIITISGMGRSPLQKQSDILLPIPKDEREVHFGAISSRIASFVYTDLLYLKLAQSDLQGTKEKLVQTKTLVKRIL